MSPGDAFAHELAALLAACGLAPAPSGPDARVTAGSLDLHVHLAGPDLLVDLSGWRHSARLGDDEDGDDAAALALDLIGAALFGDLRILVERWGGRPRRFTLQLRLGERWQPGPVQGARPLLGLFAARTTSLHHAALARPAAYRPNDVAALPWAPWAGRAGFFGAAAREPAAAELPIDGELDLHNFSPKDVKRLVLEYLDVCLARGITEVRIVHGKGIGALRRTVHALLDRHPRVLGYRLGGHRGGGWGATVVDLSPGPASDPDHDPGR
ncbi:Smr/MutS family protein [Nannocystis pusilla]|uniref:Smr/MutS family protein n=1 Tax=Nannocystis pusilla TaxID=889268 RepID=A0ABS7TQQ5_9BACT|nr:Smr/MutS family protein [Nannocystis pusilla]MBZ5710565.1 Smr/MutS family protein [Nannocystis pusilla]